MPTSKWKTAIQRLGIKLKVWIRNRRGKAITGKRTLSTITLKRRTPLAINYVHFLILIIRNKRIRIYSWVCTKAAPMAMHTSKPVQYPLRNPTSVIGELLRPVGFAKIKAAIIFTLSIGAVVVMCSVFDTIIMCSLQWGGFWRDATTPSPLVILTWRSGSVVGFP